MASRSNATLLVALLGGLALVLAGLFHFSGKGAPDRAGSEERSGSTPVARSTPVPAELEAASPAAPAPPAPDTARELEPGPEPAARAAAQSAYDLELTEALWVEGRVLVPLSAPGGEPLRVMARGKDFEHGPQHTADVAADGSFRVAFARKTRRGRLELESRFLYLDHQARVTLDSEAEQQERVVLEPRLGARLAGRLIPPEGMEAAEFVGCKVNLRGMIAMSATSKRQGFNQFAHLPAGLAYEFGPCPVEEEFDLSVQPERAAFAGREGLTLAAGEVTTVDLAPRRGCTVAGSVLNPAGEPQADVEVSASTRQAWRSGKRSAKTDADGAFALHGLEAGLVDVEVAEKGFVPVHQGVGPLADGEEQRELVLVLDRGLQVTGMVTWPDGSPASNSFVYAERRDDDQWFVPWMDPLTFHAGEDGRFTLTGLEDGEYAIKARMKVPEHLRTEDESGRKKTVYWSAEVLGIRPGDVPLALTLTAGLTLVGSVVDETGAPLERFSIEADQAVNSNFMGSGPSTTRRSFDSPGGAFEYTGLQPGPYRIRASSKEHGSSASLAVDLPTSAPIRLVLPRGATVRGLVLAPGGAPVAGALVSVREEVDAERGFVVRSTGDESRTTSEDGSFELSGLSAGTAHFSATATGYGASEELTLLLAPGEVRTEVILELNAAGTLTGLAVARNGGPAALRRVDLQFHGTPFQWRDTETDTEGRFRFDDLSAGRWTAHLQPTPEEVGLQADPDNDDDWSGTTELQVSSSVTIVAGEVTEIVLDATGAERWHVSGTVTSGGEPVSGGWIRIEGAEKRQPKAGEFTTLGKQGSYRVSVEQPGEYTLTVMSSAGTASHTEMVVVGQRETVHDIALPTGAIAGRVTDAEGRPIEGAMLRVQPVEGSTPTNAWTRSDAEGRYELVGLEGGTYSLLGRGDDETAGAFGNAKREDVSVASGARVEGIDLVLPQSALITGFVRDGAGSAVAGMSLIAWNRSGALVHYGFAEETDWEGRFELTGLVAESLSLAAVGGARAARPSAWFEAAEGARVECDLRAGPGTTVTLEAEDADGATVSASFAVRDSQGRDWSAVRARGSWFAHDRGRIGPLPPGTYAVSARGTDGLVAERQLTVDGAEPQASVQLTLAP